MHTKTLSLTRILLLCGAIAGPLFIFTVLIQDYTRPGFDPRLDPLSLLSLGDWGWVQMVNFALAGVLNLLYAVSLWRRLHTGRAGTWGAVLIGAYGLGLLLVSIFRPRQWVSAGGYHSNTPFLARRYPRPGRPLCLRYAVGSAGGTRSAILGMEGALVGFLLLGERRAHSPHLF